MTKLLLQNINALESYLNDLTSLSCGLERLGFEEEADQLDELSLYLKGQLNYMIADLKKQQQQEKNLTR